MDEILSKLKDALLKNGVPEDVVEFSFNEAMSEPEAVEEVPAEPVAEEIPPEVVEEAPVEAEVPAEEELLPPEEEVAPEAQIEEPQPIVPPELLAQLQDQAGQINELNGQIEELKKANEGLLARFESFSEALKQAGLIEGNIKPVDIGIHQPQALSNNPVDDPMDDVLARINSKRGF